MNIILSYLLANLLIIGSMGIGFILTSIFIITTNPELPEEDKGIHLNSFLEELENEPMSNLSEDELVELKNKIVTLRLFPLINHDIKMFYEHKTGQFIYYCDCEMTYKYLDIVARYYVLTFHCKQLYIEIEESIAKTLEDSVTISGPFISKKSEKKLLEKKFLQFLCKGNLKDFERDKASSNTNDKKNIDILEFMKQQKDTEIDNSYENVMKED